MNKQIENPLRPLGARDVELVESKELELKKGMKDLKIKKLFVVNYWIVLELRRIQNMTN